VRSATTAPRPAARRWAAGLVAALITVFALAAVATAGRPAVVATPAASPSTAVVVTTARPTATIAPAASAAPAATPASVTRAATAAPVVAAAPAIASDPAAAVVSFYQLVTARRYGDAAGLWSTRMRSSYPPSSSIDQRFADTRSISADRAVVTSRGLDTARVDVFVTEVTSSGTRHWTGTWHLVRSGSVWLLDAPQLAPA
jgi:hypothetical protein